MTVLFQIRDLADIFQLLCIKLLQSLYFSETLPFGPPAANCPPGSLLRVAGGEFSPHATLPTLCWQEPLLLGPTKFNRSYDLPPPTLPFLPGPGAEITPYGGAW